MGRKLNGETQRRREEEIEERIQRVVALDCKSPPFASFAKDGAPSSSSVE